MSFNPLFRDRTEAGEKLAAAVSLEVAKFNETLEEKVRPIVYGLPRGGLPIALPIARQLCCPLDVIVAKKITRPEHPELAIGAVTADGHILWSNQKSRLRVPNTVFQKAQEKAQEKAQAQLMDFSSDRPQISPMGALAIIVDDGIATGMTIRVAAQALRLQEPMAVWICVPVAPLELMECLSGECDRTIILETPDPFFSVSNFYAEFPQVETEVVIACLQQQTEWRSI
ncbi:phosphoribosyltransferase [Oscillatoriales cyanobacterium USR001]|nr:phosphoribosyltransferase [Oscillatoriales cyanobacterium USR001]